MSGNKIFGIVMLAVWSILFVGTALTMILKAATGIQWIMLVVSAFFIVLNMVRIMGDPKTNWPHDQN